MFPITLSNFDWFSKLVHCSIKYLFLYKTLILFPDTRYTCNLYALWNESRQKTTMFLLSVPENDKCQFFGITAYKRRSEYPSLANIQTPGWAVFNSFVKDTLFPTDSHVSQMLVHCSHFHYHTSYENHTPLLAQWVSGTVCELTCGSVGSNASLTSLPT